MILLVVLACLLVSISTQTCKPANKLGPCLPGNKCPAPPSPNATCIIALNTCCKEGALICDPKNDPPTQADLWDLRYYYNPGRILHAFAATAEGRKKIQNNGIGGYTSKPDEGSMGATLSDEGYKRMDKFCTDEVGKKNIVQMWFRKSGQAYQHIFDGAKPDDVYVGYVSIKENACGANRKKIKWSCSVSADMFYSANMAKNAWYAGRQQDGGKVHFWLWEMDEEKRNKLAKGPVC